MEFVEIAHLLKVNLVFGLNKVNRLRIRWIFQGEYVNLMVRHWRCPFESEKDDSHNVSPDVLVDKW